MKPLIILLATHLIAAQGPTEPLNQPTPEDAPQAQDSAKVVSEDSQPQSPDSPPPSTWDRQQNRTSAPANNEGVTMGMQALKTLFGLGIVLALLFLSSKLVSKKLGTVRWKSKEGRLQVADFMLLDGKSGIYLVQIDGADWIVVTGPHGTSLAPKDSTKRSFQLKSSEDSELRGALDLKSASLVDSSEGESP